MKYITVFVLLSLLVIAGCVEEGIPVQEQGEISVYFCPRDDCEQVFVDFLDSAESSVYCALYDMGLKSIIDKLLDKSKAMEVKLVVDDKNYGAVSELEFAKSGESLGLMHNKFCVVDARKVLTGSFNPTYKGTYENNNNIVIIESEKLVYNYIEEFTEFWNGVFVDGAEVQFPAVMVDDIKVENYFCPEDNCADRLKQQIADAQGSIYFMVFSFTDNNIANELIIKHYDGIKVKGIVEKSQQTKYSVFELLKFQGINVTYDHNKAIMHHKVFIIDNKTVITGSYNPTRSGNTRNDENMLIIHDEKIAQMFLKEFKSVSETKT